MPSPAYEFLNLEEQAFVEALVDHMIPADDLTQKGTDLMTDAPGDVQPEQLKELHISSTYKPPA